MSDTQPNEQNKSTERSLAGETGSVTPWEYPNDYRWVVETRYGNYSTKGWGFSHLCQTKEQAVQFCEDWIGGPRWDIYRVYDNHTGETITASPNNPDQQPGPKETP